MKVSEKIFPKDPYHFQAQLSLNGAKLEWEDEVQRDRERQAEEVE